MATQRVTIAKIAGDTADAIVTKLHDWAAARTSESESTWSGDQWPAHVREQIDTFAEQVRSHSTAPPVVHFVEWVDMWSMYNVFQDWLTPRDGPVPFHLCANRYTVYGYSLPDGGQLEKLLKDAVKQQWPESDWYIRRLREAITACERVVDRAAVIVLRLAYGVAVSDDEVRESLSRVPDWLLP